MSVTGELWLLGRVKYLFESCSKGDTALIINVQCNYAIQCLKT